MRQDATARLNSDASGVATAAALLREGQLVAIPTETVYGLGADAQNASAVAALYEAKGRPLFNPLIAHLPDAHAAMRVGSFDRHAAALAEAFWPGPLTLVVPLAEPEAVCDLARAGLPSVGLRVPAHPVAIAILAEVGRPVVAPSANRSGRISPTQPDHVLEDLAGRVAAVVDGGACPVGVESTIVACLGDGPRLLRPGGLPRAELERALGHPLGAPIENDGRPIAPGALLSHYAPASAVRLDAEEIEPGEAALWFGPAQPPGLDRATAHLNLSPTSSPAEAAANLFAYLRRLDATAPRRIAVAPIPPDGLGEAINDRLRRAAVR